MGLSYIYRDRIGKKGMKWRGDKLIGSSLPLCSLFLIEYFFLKFEIFQDDFPVGLGDVASDNEFVQNEVSLK